MPIEQVKTIIQSQLIERVTRLPEGYFERHMQLQRDSPFWMKVFNRPEDADITYRPTIKSREWAEYVVDACRIYFEAGLSVKKAVSVINCAIRYVAICLLNKGTEKIYFEDGRNIFYEFESRGMPAELKEKYKAFLKGMKASMVESGKAHSEPRSEGAVEQKVVDIPSIIITPPMEPSTAPAEPEASIIKNEEKRDDQKKDTKKPQPKKKGRSRTRNSSKCKGKKKAARKAMLVPKSANVEDGTVKKGKWWRKNQKNKEKMKKRKEAAKQAAGA